MAIVKDYYKGNTHICIHDDAYADLTEEEIRQRKEIIQERVNQIAQRMKIKESNSA